MPQPRREQIKDLLTKHSLFSYTPTVGAAYDTVLNGVIHPYTISASSGGVQESVQATVLGTTIEPFAAMAGASFTININGHIDTVNFAGTDTTTSKVAAAINAAVTSVVASNENGYLRISNLVIPNINLASTMVLTDGGATPLNKFGISGAPTTYYGYVSPVRGVVTTSTDCLGGVVQIKTTDGKSVVTDAGYLSQIATLSTSPFFTRKSNILGGIPIHGRILRNSANTGYNISYYATMAMEPEVISANSDFASLDGTDSVTLTFSAGSTVIGPFAVDFPVTGPPRPAPGGYTRDLVVDRINEIFSTTTDHVTVVGTVCQPFGFIAGGETFNLVVDGVAQSFNLLPTDVTYTAIAAKILAAFPGLTVTGPIENGNIYIGITSTKAVGGIDPSLEFIGNNWLKLGFSPGLYKGYCFAEGYGNSEIKIRGIGRGSDAIISIVGVGPNTLARLGIPAVMRRGSDSGEQKINFPDIIATGSGSGISVNCLIPEVIEFGEVNPAVDSIVEQFNNKSAGSNQEGSWLGIADNTIYGHSKGSRDAGKPVVTNIYGGINLSLLRPAYDEARRTFSKFIRGNFDLGHNTVDALVTNVIETTGTGGNPKSTSATFTVDVDPSNAHALRDFRVELARDTGAVTVPFRVKDNTIPLTNTTHSIELSTTTGIHGVGGGLKFSDANTVASGSPNTLSLTSPDAFFTRVCERYANNAHPTATSLLLKANSIWTVTVGDGVISFGDFNGTFAIQQAIDYWNSTVPGTSGLRIQCKAGTFEVNVNNSSIVITGDLILDGVGVDATTIVVTDFTACMVDITGSIILNDLTIKSTNAGTDGLVRVKGSLKARNVKFDQVVVKMIGPGSTDCLLEDCYFSVHYSPCVTIYLVDGTDSGPYTFYDCEFNSATSFPVLSIAADDPATPSTIVDSILFDNCVMNLSSTTPSAGNLNGNCGVVDMVPNGSAYPATGICVNEIKWRDCVVTANVGLSGISTLIHLIPTDNKETVADLTTTFAKIKHVVIDGGRWMCPSMNTTYNPFTILGVDNITIKNVELGFLTSADFTYGGATKDSQFWCDGVGGVIPTTEWGAFALYANEKLTVSKVRFTNLTRHGSIGDLFIRYKYIDMDGIDMTSMYTGGAAGATPTQRVRFRSTNSTYSQNHGGVIKNILFDVGTVAVGQVHSTNVVYYEPTLSTMKFDNVRIFNFKDTNDTSGSTAFLIPDVAAGALYAGSLNDTSNLTITNSSFNSNYGGFVFYSTTSTQSISRLSITNSEFIGNVAGGIQITALSTSGQLGNITISNNIVSENLLGGIIISAKKWDSGSYAVVTSNVVCNNTAAPTGRQITVSCPTGVASQVPAATITGNSTRYGSDIGEIYCSETGGGMGEQALTTPATRAEVPIYGVETSRDAVGLNHFEFGDGVRCLYNDAILKTT